MAEAIDTAYVDIRPDFSGFAVETERGIRRQLAGIDAAGAVGVGRTDTRGIKTATRDLDAMDGSLRKTRASGKATATQLGLLGGSAARAGVLAGAGVAGLGVGVALGVGKVTQASIEFETAFSGVRKTVSATRPELAGIREDILNLSTEIPVTATELANIGEAAGQLGIQTSEIGSFTKVVAELGVTTNLTSEQAADAFARIANITQLPQGQFENMGSTVVALGNRLAATESEITDFGLRIAGAGHQVGLSQSEILSIGAALSSVGLEAEAGGTAISTTLIKIASAVAKGGKQLQNFADVAGVSSKEFADQFERDPAQALVAFVSGLGDVKEEGGNVFATLEKLGLGGIRVRDALLRSAGAGDLLARSLKIGDEAWKNNTALQREAGIRFDTTAAKIQVLRNQVTALSIDLGDKLGPAIGEGAEAIGGALESLRSNDSIGDTIARGFENLRSIVEPLFAVFERNKGTIANTFRNAGEAIRVASVIAKPFAIVIGATLVAAFEVLFFAIDKANGVVSLFGDAFKKSVSIAVGAADLFLGALSQLTGAIDKIPGVDLSGTTDAIDAARENLRGFVDDLNGVDGKTVTADVKVNLPTAEVDAFVKKMNAATGGGFTSGVIPGQPTFGISKLPKAAKPGKGGAGDDGGLPPPLVDVPKFIQAKEQRLQDNVALAQAIDESTANDKQALGILARFYDEQANNMKLSAALRRGFLVKAAQTRQAVRDLDATAAAEAQQDAQDAQDAAETRARGAIAAAEATKGTLVDDIRAARDLVSVLRDRVALAKQTGTGVASARADLAAAERGVTDKINERKERRADIRVDRAKTLVEAADATKTNLADDIRSRQRLVAVLRERLRVAKETGGDVAAAKSALDAATRDLGTKIRDVNDERANRILDVLEDNKTLASFTEGTADDRKVLVAERRFWQKRVASLKAGSVERRKAVVELERTKKEIRDLGKKSSGSDAVGGTTLADLFAKSTAISKGAGFDVGPQIAGRVTDPIESQVAAKLSLPDPTVTVTREDRNIEKQIDSNDKLIAALERLATVVAGNAGANGGGGGTHTAAPGPGGRWGGGRYWQARRNAALHEETASA